MVDEAGGACLNHVIRNKNDSGKSHVQDMSARKGKKTTAFILKQMAASIPLMVPASGSSALPKGRFVFPKVANRDGFVRSLAKCISDSAEVVARLEGKSPA